MALREDQGKRDFTVTPEPRGEARPHEDRDRVGRPWPGKRGPAPVGLQPALCTWATAPPTGEGWIHELKLDGYRALAWLRDGKATIRTRGGKDWTARFPELAAALEALPVRDALLDGEIVAVGAGGVPDFGALQRWLGDTPGDAGQVRVAYYAFDLPWVEGHDLRDAPLVSRKEALSALLVGAPPPLRYMDHVSGRGPEFFAETCRRGLEGSVAKRADSRYPVGRSRDWVKVKCPREARLRVVGWTEPGGTRAGFGALLLAREDGGRLRYAGRVGTGFDARALDRIPPRLRARSAPPVEAPPAVTRGVHWVEPDLLAEVSFTEETNEGLLRHPVFLRLVEPTPTRVRLTHPDRVLWPDLGVTKRELAAWYAAAGARALPHLAGRPLTLLRCPDGQGKPCFFQRHFQDALPPGIRGVQVPGRDETYLAIDGMEGLLGLAQMGVLEIHPWGARIEAPDRADRLVFDLDPDPALPWSRLVDAALAVRDRLHAAGLAGFPRLTGGKGVHVVVPLQPGATWAVAKAYCREMAEAVSRADPARYTAKMAKSERRGRVFVDWLRNAQTATAVGCYSTRARAGAPVAMPVTWDELADARRGDRYDVRTALARLDAPDPWPDLAAVRQSLPGP